jgi:hypothetical protein
LDSFFKDVKVTGEIKKSKTYFFSCLNRKPRYWRSKLIYIIQQDDFLRSKSLCSHPKIYSKNEISDHTGFDVEDEMGNFFVNLPELQASTEHPLEINMTFNNVISHLPEVFSEVAFDLCMESYQEGIHIHNTEKIFKPMVNSIPLLIWGTPGVNTNQLSNIGFKTYEDWFDLSFDSELDTEKRLHLLVKEVRRVCNMLASYNDEQLLEWQNKNTSVIEHNKMTVLNQLPMNKIEFNRLFEDLGRA